MPFLTGSISKRGSRASNQDACGHLALGGVECWAAADGLGGHRGGEVASKIAVEAALASFRADRRVMPEAAEQHISAAHGAIIERQRSQPKLSQMRTTLVVLVSDGRSFVSAHVGDSRLYYLHDGCVAFQTKDHSVPQALAAAGDISSDQIRFHEDRNRLLRSLGTEESPTPEIHHAPGGLSEGDAFLLCVDGFWEYVWETEMEADFAKSGDPAEWLERMEARLLRRAPESHDNYTAAAVFLVL